VNFRIGQRVTGYDTTGMPVTGRISAFGETPTGLKIARIRYTNDDSGKPKYCDAVLHTLHPLPLDMIKHKKSTFLAAAARISPPKYFKDDVSQRDFLEFFWQELSDYTDDE
jgi:hypothetical protein